MTNLANLTLLDWMSALGGRSATPAGGSLALVTLGGTAALAGKILRVLGQDFSAFEGLSQFFVFAAAEDGQAYEAARKTGTQGALDCLHAGLRHLETALQLLEAIGDAFDDLPPALAADMAAAGRLARASAQTLLANLAVNLSQWSEALPSAVCEQMKEDLDSLKCRLDAA